jgi:lipid-A-disaccharide synthase-like uncharacterized protein
MVSNMTAFLTVAYAVMGFVSLFGYFPQMLSFWRSPAHCLNTPLLTWVLWAAQTVVFHAYALLVNGDPVFILSTGMFMVATLGCLYLLLRGRRLAVAARENPNPRPTKLGGNVVALRRRRVA